MDCLDLINSRRSVRNFNDKDISSSDIELILKSAMSAPTARNQQGWRFVVVDDKDILSDISKGIEHGKMCKNASKVIVVCYEIKDEMSELYWIQDASAATQNILLSAASIGIASVWVAVHPRVEKVNFITKTLNLPSTIRPLSIVALGYREDFLKDVNRYDENKIRYNSWS